MQQPLGKGEVESSILSHSTRNPQHLLTLPVDVCGAIRASESVNVTGTAAQNWHKVCADMRRKESGIGGRRRKTCVEYAWEQKYHREAGRTDAVAWYQGSQDLSLSELYDAGFQDRFWAKVDRSKGCWEWQGSKDRQGYGRVKAPRRRFNLKSHRVAFALANCAELGNQIILHSCDNPSCCNPAHLSIGTHSENMQQMYDRGRR